MCLHYRDSRTPCLPARRTCHAGKWVGRVPSCVPFDYCERPPIIRQGIITECRGVNLHFSSSTTAVLVAVSKEFTFLEEVHFFEKSVQIRVQMREGSSRNLASTP